MLQVEKKAHQTKFKSGLIRRKNAREGQKILDAFMARFKRETYEKVRHVLFGFHNLKIKSNRITPIKEMTRTIKYQKRTIRRKVSMVLKYKTRLR
jgi:hypothetical protein